MAVLERKGRVEGGPTGVLRALTLLARCLLLMAAAGPLFAATFIHSPYLQNMRQDQVTIVWSFRESLTCTVQFSTDQSLSQTAIPSRQFVAGAGVYQYRAVLTGLTANTSYSYRVIAAGTTITNDVHSTFRTAPASGPFRFIAFGDSGLGTPEQLKLAVLMNDEPANLILHVGDLAYESGTYQEFLDQHFAYYAAMLQRLPFFPVPGNHEYYTDNAAPYLALHAPPFTPAPPFDQGRYYSFDWGDVHFAAIDANLLDARLSAAGELTWLDQDLASSNARWKIVYWHQTPYPVQHHLFDPVCIAARQQLVPIVERRGVQLVLTGHEHNYMRTKPLSGGREMATGASTLYVSTGGGGGESHPVEPQPFIDFAKTAYHYLAVDVDASQITIRAIGLDGKEFDRAVLVQPTIAEGGVVNAASFAPALAPGGLMSIFGTGLAAQLWSPRSFPLPTVLAGTRVTLNGTPLPLIYTSTGQINAQIPFEVRGQAILSVTTLSGTSQTPVTIQDTAPAVFPSGVLHADGRAVNAASPAVGGETVVIYMTGLGEVNGNIGTGQPAPAGPARDLEVLNPVQVDVGDRIVTPLFAGLTPNFVGLYQVNVTMPRDLTTAVYPLRVVSRGIASMPLNVPVRQTP
jgi:uncharacterized protein (TIGR03437 family)